MEIKKNHYISDIINRLNIEISASGFVHADKEWSDKNICSPFSRLYFVESGEGIIKYDNKKIFLKPKNMYLIPTGLRYSYWCESEMDKLFFHINLYKPDGYDVFAGVNRCIMLECSAYTVKNLKEIYFGTTISKALQLKKELYSVAARFISELGLDAAAAETYSVMVQKAIDYIQLNLSDNLTISELCEKLYVSESTLRKNFKNEVGITIGRYIDDLLFFTAQKLLQKSEWTIGQISESLGFCDQFYFSRRFKERYNITPLKYRKKGNAM